MKTKNLILTAACIAIGVVLPQAFHMIPNAGSIFLPMHIPVLLCGLICSWQYGLVCGILTPMLSSLLTGMPPVAYLPAMVVELAIYGAVAGVFTMIIRSRHLLGNIYGSLLAAMIAGRIGYGVVNALIFRAGKYSLELWLTASFVTSLPGIVVQIIAIPAVCVALHKANIAFPARVREGEIVTGR